MLQPVCRIHPPLVHSPGVRPPFTPVSLRSACPYHCCLLGGGTTGEGRGRGKRGLGGGSLEVSLTILRNFADSLARVDHVRPVLHSHGSGREGENGFSRGSEGSEGEKRGERERRAGPG